MKPTLAKAQRPRLPLRRQRHPNQIKAVIAQTELLSLSLIYHSHGVDVTLISSGEGKKKKEIHKAAIKKSSKW